ncbi:hypothetical protein Micbo1qcDRAFT_170115 [Microdochium bolleyi]|uniref:Uncharacterized protein n=1 Tax=Microdochium bolleyi TaxID=196109 RepID=A0A136II32_9PEZI|nr:hypothetical protein Micbo1qcDRAFT_170115 [Microdochium bolleyi]
MGRIRRVRKHLGTSQEPGGVQRAPATMGSPPTALGRRHDPQNTRASTRETYQGPEDGTEGPEPR